MMRSWYWGCGLVDDMQFIIGVGVNIAAVFVGHAHTHQSPLKFGRGEFFSKVYLYDRIQMRLWTREFVCGDRYTGFGKSDTSS